MGEDVVLEATFLLLLLPLLFLGMGVVGDGLLDTSFFLVGVTTGPVLILGDVLLSPVLDPGGDFRPAVVVFEAPVGEALPDVGGDTVVGFFVGFEVTEVLLGT